MLVSRLEAEVYKLDILKRDLASIKIILNALRNLELFPPELTQLNENQIVRFNRTIEDFENRHQILVDRTNSFKMPLTDALSILRELVVGEPVEEMFKIIEKGDIERINHMLEVKHTIDTLWRDIEIFLSNVKTQLGFQSAQKGKHLSDQEEFLEIIRANLGRQWEGFFRNMESIKDSLAARASESQRKTMYRYEHYQLKQDITEGHYQLSKRKIAAMRKRYPEDDHKNLALLSAQVHYELGEYEEVLKAIDGEDFDSTAVINSLLLKAKSLYAQKKYGDVWNLRDSIDFDAISGSQRNLLLWLIMESGLHTNAVEDMSSLANLMDKKAGYNFHVFHTLGRSYILQKDFPIALSVFKSAIRFEPQTRLDKLAYQRLLLSIGQIQYEMNDYEEALKSFFPLLNEQEVFSEALFGIVWCYIQTNSYHKAETSLRKLINQNPQSPFAVEAILLMGKRFINKAQFEWQKSTHLQKEEYRIAMALEKIRRAISRDDSEKNERMNTVKAELQTFLNQLREEKRYTSSDIESLFNKAQQVCRLVAEYYETGSFQQISFSQKREDVLHKLDSLLLALSSKNQADETLFSSSREKITQVKELVRKSRVLSTEIAIEQFRWQKEHLNWQKQHLLNKKHLYSYQHDSISKSEEYKKALARYDSLIDSLVYQEKERIPRWQDELIEAIDLTQRHVPLDTVEDIYFRYHLGELYYAKENQHFAHLYETYEKEYMRYDSLLSLYHDGKLNTMPLAPEKPSLDHQKSIALFSSILRKYPSHHAAAPVEYSLAWCYNDLGILDSAVYHMKQLTSVYSQSSYTPQAWMYIGEYYFDNATLDSAAEAYHSVMNFPDSKWFDEALYKLAWTNYRMSNPEKAISSFLALIDMEGAQKLGKPLLEKESIDYIAISFSESDPTGDNGLRRAESFVRKYGDDIRGPQILFRLAEVYREQGRYDMAKKSFNALLAMYPHGDKNHHVENGLLDVSERDMSITQSAQAKVGFFHKYNNQSSWAEAQSNTSTIEEADSMASSQLYDAAILYHQLALQENDSTIYAHAAKTYETFIHYYPKHSQANECHYNFAEILFSMGEYYRATNEYIAVSKHYPESKYRETAAWNAIVASQLLMRKEEERQ